MLAGCWFCFIGDICRCDICLFAFLLVSLCLFAEEKEGESGERQANNSNSKRKALVAADCGLQHRLTKRSHQMDRSGVGSGNYGRTNVSRFGVLED